MSDRQVWDNGSIAIKTVLATILDGASIVDLRSCPICDLRMVVPAKRKLSHTCEQIPRALNRTTFPTGATVLHFPLAVLRRILFALLPGQNDALQTAIAALLDQTKMTPEQFLLAFFSWRQPQPSGS